MRPVLARLSGVRRRFGGVTALAGADLEVRAGEVHGVLGENGAGKTTLLNVLGGLLRPDAGTLELDGAPVSLSGPRDAWAHGIGLVHQHFTLVPALSVLENLVLGRRTAWGGLGLPHEGVRAEADRLMARTGLDVPLDVLAEELGVGDRQRVEITKALLRSPRILVLDEPTAVLAPGETVGLFALLRALASEGRAVVLVAHKLDEVIAVADRVTVLRAGRTVLSAPAADVDVRVLIEAMVGREVDDASTLGWSGGTRARPRQGPGRGADGRATAAATDAPPREPPGGLYAPSREASGDVYAPSREAVGGAVAHVSSAGRDPHVVARLEGVRVRARRGEWALAGASLTVHRGEIIGVAGVEGNGQRELARVLAGRLRPDQGAAEVPPGVGYIPQDRTTEGLVAGLDLAENVALALHRDERFRRGVLLRWERIRRRTDELCREHDVRAAGSRTLAGTLSGGNQQRLVVARELAMSTDLLVAESPTRGLDVAATSFVHAQLRRLTRTAGEGPGVVLISSDLDEVLALSHRTFALVSGRLIAVPERDRTREGVGALMLRRDRDGDEAA